MNIGHLSIYSTKVKWEIEVKELTSKQRGENIQSPSFCILDLGKQMFIELFPKGDERSTKGYMSLYLRNASNCDFNIDSNISFIDNNGKIIQEKILGPKQTLQANLGLGWINFAKECFEPDPTKKIIKNSKFTIYCSLEKNDNQLKLRQINEDLFTNKKFADFTIKAKGKKFHLHKAFLATHSSVFEAMFETEMKEKNENQIEICDVEPEILNQFFKFMYTYKVDNLEEIASDLLYVAEKYLVNNLKILCIQTMNNNVNENNAVKYLKLSELYNAQELKSEMIKFITSNLKKMYDKPEFKTLTQENLLDIINYQMDPIRDQESTQ